MKKLEENILKLRSEGKSYSQICEILQCSKGVVCYHLGKGQKEKSYARNKNSRTNHINTILSRKLCAYKNKFKSSIKEKNKQSLREIEVLIRKLGQFRRRKTKMDDDDYNSRDILNKFGPNPKCYLTGETIDLSKSHTYHFDHIIPICKGGSNSLDNLEICSKDANQSKCHLTVDEYIDLCKKVLTNFGYIISK